MRQPDNPRSNGEQVRRPTDPGVIISPGLHEKALRGEVAGKRKPRLRLRATLSILSIAGAFGLVAGQLVRLASLGGETESASISRPLATAFSRPDIVDRNGRLLANDVVIPSLYADPSIVLDADEVADKLSVVMPSLSRDVILDALKEIGRAHV